MYFDIFNFQEVVNILRDKYHLEPTSEEIRVGDKFSFALCFDKKLNLCESMTFFTMSAYVRWFNEIPEKNVFGEYESNLKRMVSQLFEDEEDRKNVFNDAIGKLLKKYNIDVQKCRVQVVNNIETDATNLHSFFVDDLEKAKLIKTENFESYLWGKTDSR